MGMIISVFKDASSDYDCTNGGLSSKFNKMCVVNVDGPFSPDDECPAVYLVQGPAAGSYGNPILVPAEIHENSEQKMFGGNFGYCSDSRFARAVEELCGHKVASTAVRIHDRQEW